MITTIGFDADDTLWHNQAIFEAAHGRCVELLSRYHDRAEVDRELYANEMRNLPIYGYGIKAFALDAIETAIRLSGGRVAAEEIQQILDLARQMLAHPVELLPGVKETVIKLAETHTLLVVTKGDVRDQERKLIASGLSPNFRAIEVLGEKDLRAYADVLRKYRLEPAQFLMVGNSLKSDIFPVLKLGGAAAFIPYALNSTHESVDVPVPTGQARFVEITAITELPAALEKLDGKIPRG